MPRSVTASDGDRAMIGVDERRDPGQLEPGLVSRAINEDFSNSEMESRRGFHAPRPQAGRAFDFPFDFPLNFSNLVGHGKVFGAIPFADRGDTRFIIIALERYALKIHESGTIVPLRYPLNTVLLDKVEMRQADDRVYILRGKSFDPMVWDGDDRNDIENVVRTGLAPGVQPFPRTSLAEYYLDRFFALEGRDQLLFSDIGGLEKYNLSNQFKIDSGSHDTVTKVLPFGQRGIIVAQESSIDFIDNLVGDIAANARRTRLSNEIGCTSPDTMVDVGADVWFLAERGVFSIRQALDNQLQSDSEPLSRPLQPVFQRLNWQQKKNFRAVWWDNKYIIAAALDNSILNNVLIIYNFITETWHGFHQADFFDAERLFTVTASDTTQLFAVSNEGVIYRLYVTFEDDPLTGVQDIVETLHTRGYGAADMDRKRFQRIHLDISEWCAEYDILVQSDGKNEIQFLSTIARDRTKFHTAFTPRFDPTNINDNHGAPHREDYSVCLAPKTFDFPFDFPLDFQGPRIPPSCVYDYCLGESGTNFDCMQRVEEKKIVNRSGDYLQILIEKRKGRIRLHGAKAAFVERQDTSLTRT